MNTRWIQLLLCLFLGCPVGMAHAIPTLVTNLVPDGPLMSVEVNGQILIRDVGYLDFREIDVPAGTHSLRLLDSTTGAELTRSYPEQPWVAPARPSLVIALVWKYGGYRQLATTSTAGTQNRMQISVVYGAEVMQFERWVCGGGPEGEFGYNVSGGDDIASMNADTPYCRFDLTTVRIGDPGVVHPTREFTEDGIYHLFYVGNGTPAAPYHFIVFKDGVLQSELPFSGDQLRKLKSQNYWYDSGRYSQGVTLYEVSRTLAVHGIWNVFAEDGRARWIYLDGGVVDSSGRREVMLYEYQLDQHSQRQGNAIGQGTLTYLDCNQAELQVRFADGTTRAAQLRRSVSVETCAATP